MNKIKQIINERLENARLDFGKTIREPQLELKGQIEAYQDCLNLMQPRTEADILNDFEKLGYEVVNSHNHPFIEMSKYNGDFSVYEYIAINKAEHNYEKFAQGGDVTPITMQEHKLLNELFICWGWL